VKSKTICGAWGGEEMATGSKGIWVFAGKMQSTLKLCSTKDTWLILHICSEFIIYIVFMAFFDNQVGCSISYGEKFCGSTCQQRLLKFMFCKNQWYPRLFSSQQWSHTLILLVSMFGKVVNGVWSNNSLVIWLSWLNVMTWAYRYSTNIFSC
jgi:hypothetical protein